jgi:5-methylcytosine-specific restriction endonuclease McrA
MPKLIGDKPLTPAERTKRWREKHPEKARQSWQKWQQNNKEKARENSRKSYAKHADVQRAKDAQWRAENPEAVRNKARKTYWSNPEKHRERSHLRRVKSEHFLVLPKEMKRLYSQPCAKCLSKDKTTIDHIIPLSRGGRHSIGNLQTLCLSCNTQKNTRTIMEWRLGRIAKRRAA